MAASGLADLAIYEGRFSDAATILQTGAIADLEQQQQDRAADETGRPRSCTRVSEERQPAETAAGQALMHSQAVPIRFLAARTFVDTGNTERARREARTLATQVESEPRAYAKMVEAALELKAGDARNAISLLEEANKIFDTWIGHFDLGRAYLEIPGFETRADSEFDDCLKRRGEAISLFLDEEPTYGYLPVVHYYQGLGHEKIGTASESYRQYLDS